MPISKKDLEQTAQIAEFAGVPVEAVFIEFDAVVGGKVFFWTEKIPYTAMTKILSVTASSYIRSFRYKLVAFLKDSYFAEGYLTKEKPFLGMPTEGLTKLVVSSAVSSRCTVCGGLLDPNDLFSKTRCYSCSTYTPGRKRRK